jgi:acyl transferase domain-containing protein
MEVAIIGMAGRFPGAGDLEELWRNLRDGVESISRFSADELFADGVPPAQLARPGYVPAGGFLADADLFDATFFDYSPREAEVLDPQQRLLLEIAWEALESAGHAGTRRPVGVFAGTSSNSYLFTNVLSRPEVLDSLGGMGLALASDRDYIATRISYKLNLTGPSFTVQTACSTSLVAVHLACQSLLAGECELALAGAASVWSPRKSGYVYEPGGILSPDGHCRAFDSAAAGTVIGQGVGVVVLKLLDDALADGDTVHAVIRGSSINNDGAHKVGFTAPSEEGQARVIRLAQRQAGVDPGTIGYVEAHGSATAVGDPIEVAALTRAFRLGTSRRNFCAVGSIKTNIGHLDAAAGVAGLIKTVLALEKGEIPPSLHYTAPNPQIDFAASPFYVNIRRTEWRTDGGPRRAGVSSFGLGGTNAHVVLEEAPPAEPSGPSRRWQLLVLSARSSSALERATDDLAAHLRSLPEPGPSELTDVAWTLQAGRNTFRHRRALVAASAKEAARALAERDPRRLRTAGTRAEGSVAFLLPGVGDQYPGMALSLYREEPVFRREIDHCTELLRPLLGLDLRAALFPEGAGRAELEAGGASGPDLRAMVRRTTPAPVSLLHQTRIAQPAVFAVGYALARLWMAWGIRPQALLGYSLGEYTAACLAGVLPLSDALALVARRAALIEALPPGAMSALPLGEDEVRRRLTPGLSLAALNAPEVSVVAGAPEEVAALERQLAEEGLPCRRLATAHAFHSRLMEPAAEAFSDLLRSVRLAPPEIPYLSNLTGTWIESAQATDPDYWVRHLLGTVRFADAVGALWEEPGRVLLEAGPGPVLGSLALQHPASAGGFVVSSLPHEMDRRDDAEHLQDALGQLWLAGVEPDWAAVHSDERRRRVPLPTYPFERQSYWLIPGSARPAAASTARAGKLPDPADWFHIPSWKLAPLPWEEQDPSGRWLLVLDSAGVGARLAERLRAAGCAVDTVHPGDEAALAAALAERPAHVVHLACLTPEGRELAPAEARELGFHLPLSLARELGQRSEGTALHIVANGLCRVERRDPLHPEKALLLGPLRVIPQELEQIACRAIDVDPADLDEGLIERLCDDLCARDGEPLVAWRGDRRWAASFEPVRLPASEGAPPLLRERGVYLITGGLGGIGLALASHLARTVRARLALVGRSGAPPQAEETLREIEAAGSEVLVLRADVADEVQMCDAVTRIRARFGRLDGVFHAAGVPGGGLLSMREREAAEAVLAPKVTGARVLASVLGDDPPVFLVLFSSINAVIGGVGQVDYCAANAVLGALAERRGALRTIAIDWCEWEWDAWTSSWLQDPALREELKRQRLAYGLRFAEGMEVLFRVLASGLSHVVVSTRSLPAVLAERHSLGALLAGLEQVPAAARGEHDRPALTTAYVAPESAAERRLAAIWQSVLGVRQIGIHDDFFQLGGHSLLGLQLLSRMRRQLGVELPLRALFEAPTVAGIAAVLEATRRGGATLADGDGEIAPVDPETLLGSLEKLSDQQMTALLEQLMTEETQTP